MVLAGQLVRQRDGGRVEIHLPIACPVLEGLGRSIRDDDPDTENVELILPLNAQVCGDVAADRVLTVFRRDNGTTGHRRRSKCSGNKMV